MTWQTKFILIFIFILKTVTPCCFAQKQSLKEDQVPYKTMHFFNLKPKYSADDLQIILEKFKAEGLTDYPAIIVEVNSLEWGMSLVENGKGVGLYLMKVVEKEIAEGRLKALPLVNDIWVEAEALLRADSPEHPAAQSFISLVKEAFKDHG